jgi:hypothetical protein
MGFIKTIVGQWSVVYEKYRLCQALLLCSASWREVPRFPFASASLPGFIPFYAPSNKIRSRPHGDQAAGEAGLDLYVRAVSEPAVL